MNSPSHDTAASRVRVPHKFVLSAVYAFGAILLLLAFATVWGNWNKLHLVSATDPVSSLTMRNTLWVLAALELVVALLCLFGANIIIQLGLVCWLALNFLLYQVGFYWLGSSGGFKAGYTGIAAVFGVSVTAVDVISKCLFAGLLVGSAAGLVWARWRNDSFWVRCEHLKMPCPACGGHIQFGLVDIGQKIPCPHCAKSVVLREPDAQLKMSCFFCKENIIFPGHALGTKMPCPHCAKDITLVEPK